MWIRNKIEMDKVCFISLGNIYMTPYIKNYTKYLKKPYSIIFWNRAGHSECEGINKYFCFSYNCKTNDGLKKIYGYIKFYFFARKILCSNKFDVVIILQTGAAILLADVLLRYYNNKYIIDVRDYTYENICFIRLLERQLINHALLVVISSEAYKRFLPEHSYLISHNIQDLPKHQVSEICTRKKHGKPCLHIAYIGYVNYQQQHKKLMLALKNDDRFRMSFIGTRATELNAFIKEHDIQNVYTSDTFKPDEILNFYNDVDFVNNLYGNHTPTLDYALSNKLYFAAELHIPILVCPDTYMSEIVSEYAIGLVVDIEMHNLGDKLYKYYESIDWKLFDENCHRFFTKVCTEQHVFNERITAIFNVKNRKI